MIEKFNVNDLIYVHDKYNVRYIGLIVDVINFMTGARRYRVLFKGKIRTIHPYFLQSIDDV